MAKTLHELSVELKVYILEAKSSNDKKSQYRPERYNNLKLSMDVVKDKIPHVTVTVGISEVKYNINTMDKMDGSLGPDEKYIQKWLDKVGIKESLLACWKARVDNRGKITDVE